MYDVLWLGSPPPMVYPLQNPAMFFFKLLGPAVVLLGCSYSRIKRQGYREQLQKPCDIAICQGRTPACVVTTILCSRGKQACPSRERCLAGPGLCTLRHTPHALAPH